MPSDPFYRSAEWRDLRRKILERDGYRCAAPGCPRRAVVVDHKVSRRNGGTNHPSNLRSLCDVHDRQIKEMPSGRRRGGGKLITMGVDADGRPLDANHPWNGGRRGL